MPKTIRCGWFAEVLHSLLKVSFLLPVGISACSSDEAVSPLDSAVPRSPSYVTTVPPSQTFVIPVPPHQ